jgi:valyl-tRNA synthetase
MPELAKAYEPQQVEDRLYTKWQDGGWFRANPKSAKKPYSIVMPPPNITGKLHLGHVLNNTIQDILCRKARMEGKEVLWLPGTDHAGLSTQTMVERHIRNTEKKTRHDFTREDFVARVWQWKDEFGGIITRQLRKIGVSCDWSRERFTLDTDYERAVQEVFVRLFNEGHIYRGTRMVNWDPASLTALSDEEVIPTQQKGSLYYVKYELADAKGEFLTVATTRPETIMADVALAVKPGGKWAHLVGRKAIRPLHNVEIPIIADDAVEEGFGTGVLKVTPAHDKVDYEIGKRHNLVFGDILTPSAKINDPGEHDATELHGLDRFDARKRSAEMLKERGLLEKEEPYENNVGFSERAHVPIEPRLSEQWFMKYPDVPQALALLRDGHVRFHPAHWAKTYEHWLTNIQDWCISRQVWWGHRIPVWYQEGEKPKCQLTSPGNGWTQDPDTLDTWFSSWLWAYESMRSEDGTRKKFYPTSALVTGPDIIFLWVARMLIAGIHFKPNGARPNEADMLEANLAFKDVYFTGLIRDKQGRKFSKTLGNSPEPLDLISKYGADGLRFGLVRIAPQGADIRYDEKQIEEGRNFCNKLWNICRFRTMQGNVDFNAEPWKHQRSIFADELLERLHDLLEGERNVNAAITSFNFSEAAALLYDFVWNEFAARFVEASKADFAESDSPTRAGTLATFDYVMSHVLRLLHPFAPFVTEELWCELGFGTETIQTTLWPKQTPKSKTWTARARDIYASADAGRQLRGEIKIASNQKVPFTLVTKGVALSDDELTVLTALLNASDVQVHTVAPENPGPKTFTPLGELYLPATGLVDPALEKDRLNKELARVIKDLEQTRKKLNDPNMQAKAPAAKLDEWRALEMILVEKEASIREALERFGNGEA